MVAMPRAFISANPSTKLIVIDTLERIRNTDQDKSMYACDYRDMTALREVTNTHAVTLLLVYHTQKMYDLDTQYPIGQHGIGGICGWSLGA